MQLGTHQSIAGGLGQPVALAGVLGTAADAPSHVKKAPGTLK